MEARIYKNGMIVDQRDGLILEGPHKGQKCERTVTEPDYTTTIYVRGEAEPIVTVQLIVLRNVQTPFLS